MSLSGSALRAGQRLGVFPTRALPKGFGHSTLCPYDPVPPEFFREASTNLPDFQSRLLRCLRRMTPKRTRRAPPAASQSDDVPALPVSKAFVVQFSRETATQSGIFSGRIEHLSSGRRARFGSKEELFTAVSEMLDQLGENAMGCRERDHILGADDGESGVTIFYGMAKPVRAPQIGPARAP